MARSRPSQGDNSRPKRPGRPAYRADAAPRTVSQGTLSRPHARPAWNVGRLVADATPTVVQR